MVHSKSFTLTPRSCLSPSTGMMGGTSSPAQGHLMRQVCNLNINYTFTQ